MPPRHGKLTMQKFRQWIIRLLPAIAVLMIAGLILSRTRFPEPANRGVDVRIDAFAAADHVGKKAEVCGFVASAVFLPAIGGEPTFLNLGRPHPDQPFTVVIWGEDRGRFQAPPEKYYQGRSICVSGRIRLHEDVPQIRVRHPGQIVVQ